MNIGGCNFKSTDQKNDCLLFNTNKIRAKQWIVHFKHLRKNQKLFEMWLLI